jgi:hypothetical protein
MLVTIGKNKEESFILEEPVEADQRTQGKIEGQEILRN